MNTDFRITIDAFDHPKIVKLQRLCGEHGVLCLFKLWAFTARYHPRGDLSNMTDEDIEIAAKWNGKPGVFFSALIKYRMLDEMLGAYSVHDWEEHNAYAFHAPERSQKARNAAKVRWGCNEDACSNATGNAHSNAPSPNPYPEEEGKNPTISDTEYIASKTVIDPPEPKPHIFKKRMKLK